MKKLILNGTLINEGKTYRADILIDNDKIADIAPSISPDDSVTETIDARGCFVIPGVIDDQVHFREPGLTHKGSIADGSRAAAAGGVTSFMDMPNVLPPTTTLQLLEEKQEIARKTSYVNYSFYLGATTGNLDEIRKADPHTTCGVKVFMGSSTGNMLVDDPEALEKIFAESPLLIATHCEDTPIIQHNLDFFRKRFGEQIPPESHPYIRSRQACLKSSALAARLARKYHSRLHILHLSTREEPELLDTGNRLNKKITGEVCVHHLWFNDTDYANKGNFIKWNPAIKTEADRLALLQALNEGKIDVVATDHAPHRIDEKNGPYLKAASGGPMVQHSLPVMLELAEQGYLKPETVVDKMCHAPADLFGIRERGYLRKGYKADICIFKKEKWIVDESNLLYQCRWSPLEGQVFSYRIQTTFVNGQKVYDRGKVDENVRGEMLLFH